MKKVAVPAKNYKLSYLYGIIAALFYGCGNVLQAEVSKLGIKAIWTMWLGSLIVFVSYHSYQFLITKFSGSDYFVKERSNYVEIVSKNELNFSIKKFLWMTSRALSIILIIAGSFATFYFANKSGVNPGIISTIFVLNLVILATGFYFVYNQRLSC